jgi:two-component system, cell cycle sensor histidine kinase and response regulator CckA
VEHTREREASRGFSTAERPLVLLADDDEDIRTMVAEVLKLAGYEVLLASDGVTAVEVFRTNQANVAVAVLDYSMPRMDGEDAFRALRRIRHNLPVVFCSGHIPAAPAARLGRAGAAIIRKPFRSVELVDIVGRLLRSSS